MEVLYSSLPRTRLYSGGRMRSRDAVSALVAQQCQKLDRWAEPVDGREENVEIAKMIVQMQFLLARCGSRKTAALSAEHRHVLYAHGAAARLYRSADPDAPRRRAKIAKALLTYGPRRQREGLALSQLKRQVKRSMAAPLPRAVLQSAGRVALPRVRPRRCHLGSHSPRSRRMVRVQGRSRSRGSPRRLDPSPRSAPRCARAEPRS